MEVLNISKVNVAVSDMTCARRKIGPCPQARCSERGSHRYFQYLLVEELLERCCSRSSTITQPPQVGPDGLLQFRGLSELAVEFGDEALHLLVKGFAVFFDFFSSDVSSGVRT